MNKSKNFDVIEKFLISLLRNMKNQKKLFFVSNEKKKYLYSFLENHDDIVNFFIKKFKTLNKDEIAFIKNKIKREKLNKEMILFLKTVDEIKTTDLLFFYASEKETNKKKKKEIKYEKTL